MLFVIWAVTAVVVSSGLLSLASMFRLNPDWSIPVAYIIGALWPLVFIVAAITVAYYSYMAQSSSGWES